MPGRPPGRLSRQRRRDTAGRLLARFPEMKRKQTHCAVSTKSGVLHTAGSGSTMRVAVGGRLSAEDRESDRRSRRILVIMLKVLVVL